MSGDRNEVTRTFTSAFILDKAKLSRILNILEERFTGSGLAFEPRYEVTLANGKNLYLNSAEAVLALDNAVRNKIESFTVNAGGGRAEQTALAATLSYQGIHRYNIELYVASTDSKIANHLFAELEEQVERTFATGWIYRMKMGYFEPFVAFGSLLFALAGIFGISNSSRSREMLSDQQARGLSVRADTIISTEQKIDFLFEIERRRISAAIPESSVPAVSALISPEVLFVAIPLLLVLGCMFYLVQCCYPRAVFLWGDYAEHYSHILGRRKTLWTVVIASLLVGTISSLFATALTGFFAGR